jgi:hypothetical protein
LEQKVNVLQFNVLKLNIFRACHTNTVSKKKIHFLLTAMAETLENASEVVPIQRAIPHTCSF